MLMLDVNDEGALGVVLNRPTALEVSQVLAVWGDVVVEPEVLFQGGPVETDGALAVALLTSASDADVGFREVVGRLGLLDLDTPVELVADVVARLRIFAGYAGWGADQLRREIAEGSWYVVPAEADDIFRHDATDLRRDVLRRQPGDLALHSTRPVDPDLN